TSTSESSPSSTMSIPSSGSSTCRSASTTSSCVSMGSSLREPHVLAAFSREEVRAVHEPHPVAARAHDERVGACGVGEVADAAEELAVRHARRDDDHLLGCEVVDGEDPLDVVDAGGVCLLDLGAARRPELGLQLAAEAAERGGGEHGLARAADADREVVVR